jgi:predicted dehydrogenase
MSCDWQVNELYPIKSMTGARLITLDPGHFHAALVQKEMYAGVAKQVHIYAPLGGDLLAHLQRILGFNTRPQKPTAWELEVHTGLDFLERMLRERPGNVVVLSGRNRAKIDRILAAVDAGLHVLADKPWIIAPDDLPKLQAALDKADVKGLIAYDIMTERYEITSILQRELVNDAETFGAMVAGTEQEPGVFMESVHYLMKTVAGVPLRRPAWFFDIHQQGEGLTDVGPHLVDLVPWILFPEEPVDYGRDIRVLSAKRWPTVLTKANFQSVTGEPVFPAYLEWQVRDDRLEYFCNTQVSYTVRGIHTKLNILWNWEAAAGAGDTHFAAFQGTRSRVEVRQGKEQNFKPEVYVIPNKAEERQSVRAAVQAKIATFQGIYPGIALEDQDHQLWVTVPDKYRTGHEAHFAEVTNQFLQFLQAPKSLPAWEKPNMLAKYYVTTQGVQRSRQATA